MKKLKLNRQHIQARERSQEIYLPERLYRVVSDTWPLAAIFDKKTITALSGAPPIAESGWVELVIDTPLTLEEVSAVRHHALESSLITDAYTIRPWVKGKADMDPLKAKKVKLCRYGVNIALSHSAFSGLSTWLKVEGGWGEPEPAIKPKGQYAPARR